MPGETAGDAAVVAGIEIIAASSLSQAVAFLTGQIEIEPTPPRLDEWFHTLANYDVDFADVRGQEMTNRAITIAAAGRHDLLMLSAIEPDSHRPLLAKAIVMARGWL